MKNILNGWALIILMILNSCSAPTFYYQAQPVDIQITNENDRIKVTGYSVFQLPDTFVWGGSPVQIKDKVYMFFSAWESGTEIPPFSESWLTHSKVGIAVSDSPDGNFHSLGIRLEGRNADGDSTAWDAQTVHNPHIRFFDRKYYLYYVSSMDPGIQPTGSPGEKLTKRNRLQQNQKIGIIQFNSIEDFLDGKYTRNEGPLLQPRTRVKPDNVLNPSAEGILARPDNLIVVNPAVVFRPSDGKYLLYFKGNIYDPEWRGVHGVAVSDSPAGPFKATDNFVFDFAEESGQKVSAEDPFVWYHKRDKCFYAVVKDFNGKLTGTEPGLAILRSEDGINWGKAETPLFMKKELLLKDSSVLKVNNLERPQLLLDDNDDPVVLFAACSIEPCGNKQDGETFNVQIPLKKIRIKK